MAIANSPSAAIEQGARNLLLDCAGLVPGDSMLLVHEDPTLGWWQADLIETLTDAARQFGIRVRCIETGVPTNARDETIQAAMQEQSCTLFLARIGDQDRFAEPRPGQRRVMCYARDTGMLASDFGRISYSAIKALKIALDRTIVRARRIEITCPLGTRIGATFEPGPEPTAAGDPADVSIRRFPMGIVSPVLAAAFSGRAVMSHYLTPTGSAVYEPAVLEIESPVEAIIEHGRITGFDGDAGQVEAIDAHYRRIANLFDLDPFVVHSWHAGIHPGVNYESAEDANPDLWGNTVFNHPRYLHFHSCGSNSPGEISWMLRDHHVTLDDVPLWEAGRLHPDNFEIGRACMAEWPELQTLYAETSPQPA